MCIIPVYLLVTGARGFSSLLLPCPGRCKKSLFRPNMQRNSALLILTFAAHNIGDTKQLCEYSGLSRPTCTEAINDLLGIGFVKKVKPTDPRFENNKITYVITKAGAKHLCELANKANDYVNKVITTNSSNGRSKEVDEERRFEAPDNGITAEEVEIRKRNDTIGRARTLGDLLIPFGYPLSEIERLEKLPHMNVDYARSFIRSGMPSAQAISLMQKGWPPPTFDLFET